MQNRDRDHAGAFRPRRIGLFRAALAAAALLVAVPAAMAAPGGSPAAFASVSPDGIDRSAAEPAETKLELAGREHRDSNYTKPPARGSSAELNGGSSADRYGGSSADRRGVAGRYDPRNRGVRQFTAGSRKRGEPRSKQKDEMDDQDQNPPQDRYTFAPPDPGQARDRSDRD
jgi:hypothetical protein